MVIKTHISTVQIDLLEIKEIVRTPLKFYGKEGTCMARMEKKMRFSWILIDHVKKMAVNLSSRRPVEVWKHRLTEEILIHYATVKAAEIGVGFVKCGEDVTCEGKDGGVLHFSEIGMQVEDVEGKILSGRDSFGNLQDAVKGGRVKDKIGEEKKMYEMFLLRKEYNLSNPFV